MHPSTMPLPIVYFNCFTISPAVSSKSRALSFVNGRGIPYKCNQVDALRLHTRILHFTPAKKTLEPCTTPTIERGEQKQYRKKFQNSTSSEMKTFPSPSLISKHPLLGCKHRFQNTSTIENYHTVRKVGGKIIGSVDKVQVRALSAQLNDVQGEEPLICNP